MGWSSESFSGGSQEEAWLCGCPKGKVLQTGDASSKPTRTPQAPGQSSRGCCPSGGAAWASPSPLNNCTAKPRPVPHSLLCNAGAQPKAVLAAGVLVKTPPPPPPRPSSREKSHCHRQACFRCGLQAHLGLARRAQGPGAHMLTSSL